MTSNTFNLGGLTIDSSAFGSQGNAILGIRDSGKTYTATLLAEKLFEAGIPFVAFDPIGVWRFLKVPGKGRGYPVVVAGGKEPDLTLTPATAPAIVEAAMQNGISLVIDLFSIELSKADWRRIVRDSVKLLLHRNQPHGLRHVFIEEAAEFIPQKPTDWEVYAEIEKLARMGGNSRLGYTLVNQRSQEVSKAILELCENVFLHRQRGKNALENMDKWLAITGTSEQKEIIKSLPDLPQGECWAWLGGDNPTPPKHIKVPRKNSLHPDRRVMRGDDATTTKAAVDVGSFVSTLRNALPQIAEDAKANDPKALRAEIIRLNALVNKSPKPDKAASSVLQGYTAEQVKAVQKKAWEEGYGNGHKKGFGVGVFAGIDAMKSAIGTMVVKAPKWNPASAAEMNVTLRPLPAQEQKPQNKLVQPIAPKTLSRDNRIAGNGASEGGYMPSPFKLTNPQKTVLKVLRWWKALGHDAVTRAQIAALCRWKANGSNVRDRLGELSTMGLVKYPSSGVVSLTPEGLAVAPAEPIQAKEEVLGALTNPQRKVIDCLVLNDDVMAKSEIAIFCDWEPEGSNIRDRCGELSTLDYIYYPEPGRVAMQEWLRRILV